jgi:hypothetical protein
MLTPGIPHGTISEKGPSAASSTFSAKPCQVTQRLTWTPIDAIFRILPAAILSRTIRSLTTSTEAPAASPATSGRPR